MATTLASAIDFILYKKRLLFPVISVIWGVLAFAFWVTQLTWWSTCENYLDGLSDACPNFYVYESADFPSTGFWQSDLWYARLAFATVLTILALTQMALGARAMDLKQKEKKRKAGPICGYCREKVADRDAKRSVELGNLSA